MQVLNGITVIELASVLAGPSVGQFLAELGAKVYKVENPLHGDVTRSWKSKNENGDISAYYSTINWGKYPLPLNLKSSQDLSTLYDYVSKADIIISSFKPGDAEKLKVDYLTLKNFKEDLIYAAITGFGNDDQRVGYDALIQAESGFMSINGDNSEKPLKMPVALIDILAAHHLKEGILSAYIHKLKTGEGNFISVSLLDAAIVSLANQANNYLMTGNIPSHIGNEHPNIFPYGSVFYTQDKQGILLAVGTDKQCIKLCKILEIAETAKNVLFKENKNRVVNRGVLRSLLHNAFQNFNAEYLKHAFEQDDIPFGSIYIIKEAFENHKIDNLVFRDGKVTGLRQLAIQIQNGHEILNLNPPYSLEE